MLRKLLSKIRNVSPGGRDTVVGVLAFALLGGVLWYFRPWLHSVVLLVYTSPILWIAVAALVIVTVSGAWLSRDRVRGAGNAFVVGLTLFLVISLLGGTIAGFVASEDIGKQTMETSSNTNNLIETNPNQPRIATQSVASRYASNTLSMPQYQTTNPDITMRNGTPYWSYALSPDGIFNYFTKEQPGSVYVDMTEMNTKVDTNKPDEPLDRGMGTAFTNSYKWALLKQGNYLVNYQDAFMVPYQGNEYIAVPYTKPEFHLGYTTPKWGGVALVNPDGSVTDLSPQEARNNPVLKDQHLYPTELAKRFVGATKYRNGIINTFTSHEGEIELAPVPGENNDQPFTVLNKNGELEYVVAVESYGNSQGMNELWTIDARTGKYERYKPPQGAKPIGPRKAVDYVRQSASRVNWDRFTPSEPIPVVRNGTLYWETRIVSNDSAGVSYVAMVNAQSTAVRELQTTQSVEEFLAGKDIDQGAKATAGNVSASGGNTTGDSPRIVVRRVADNGTVVETMEVYGNQSVEVSGSS